MEHAHDTQQESHRAAALTGLLAAGAMLLAGCSEGASGHGMGAGAPEAVSSRSSPDASPVGQVHRPVTATSQVPRSTTETARIGHPRLSTTAEVPAHTAQVATVPTPTSSQTAPEITPSCLEPLASSDTAHMQACATLRSSDIEFVYFPTKLAEGPIDPRLVSSLAVQTIRNATDGYISPTATTITASPAALQLLRKRERLASDGSLCLPSGTSETPLADIVVSTMPATMRGHEVVVAVGAAACDKPDGSKPDLGISDPAAGRSDVYSGEQPAPQAQAVADSTEQQFANTAAHELAHVIGGLGHDGTIDGCDIPTTDPIAPVKVAVASYFDISCNADSTTNPYDEYGNAGDLLSDTFDGANPNGLLEPEQEDFLHLTNPAGVATHGTELRTGVAQTLDGSAVGVSYTFMPLPAGIINNEKLQDFSQLIFVATRTSDGNGIDQPAIRLMATTPWKPDQAQASTATQLMREVVLQTFSVPANNEIDFTVGNQTVRVVSQTDGALRVTRTVAS